MKIKTRLLLMGVILFVTVCLGVAYYLVENVIYAEKPFDEIYDYNENEIEKLKSLPSGITAIIPQSKDYFSLESTAEYAKIVDSFLKSMDYYCDNLKYNYDASGLTVSTYGLEHKDYVVFLYEGNHKPVSFDDFYVTLENGTKYAFNRSFLVNTVSEMCGKGKLEEENLVAMTGFDADGDTVSNITGAPFLFPALERSDVQYVKVTNTLGSYSAVYSESDKNFMFVVDFDKDGEADENEIIQLSYDSLMFSTMIMSCIYVLATGGKVDEPGDFANYGLSMDPLKETDSIVADGATCVMEVLTTDNKYHRIVVGDKTLDGKGYYARYYSKDFVYIISTNIENAVLKSLTEYLGTNLVYPVTTTEDVFKVDDVKVEFPDEGDERTLHVRLLEAADDDGKGLYSIWKALAPADLIPEGKTFGQVSTEYFSDFIQSLCNLSTEKVVYFETKKIKLEDGTEIYGFDTEALALYGLDKPRMVASYHFPYEKDAQGRVYGVTSKVYISHGDEDGNYYAYSTLEYDIDGVRRKVSGTGCIALLTIDTTEWLDWTVMNFTSRMLVKNYYYTLDYIKAKFDGTEYLFTVKATDKDIVSVTYKEEKTGILKDVEVLGFKYMYSAIMAAGLQDVYDLQGVEPVEMLSLDVSAKGGVTKIVFYRVSAKKAYYTMNGSGEYYVNVDDVFNIEAKVKALAAGETVRE